MSSLNDSSLRPRRAHFGIQRVIKGTPLLVLTLTNASAVFGTLRGHWKDANFKPACGRGDIRIPGLGLRVPPPARENISICRKISVPSRRGNLLESEKEGHMSF